MNKKTLFVLIIIIIVAIIGWIFLSSREKVSIPTKPAEFPTTQSTRELSSTKEIGTRDSFTILNPSEEVVEESGSIINKSLSFLAPEREVLQEPTPIIEQFIPIFFDSPQNRQSVEFAVPEKPKLTEAEIEKILFDRLYPDYFTDGLTFTQNVFVEQSFLSEDYEEIEVFDSEEKIFTFVNTIIDVFEEQGFYTEEEAVKFRVGANQTWKSILDDEKRIFRRELISSELSESIFANILFNAHKKTSKKIIKIADKLENIFIKNVQAEECFRAGGGGGVGSNISAPCCNCGLKCSSHGCVPVYDCGAGGRGCDIHFGCKNLYGAKKPVIWDSSSGICGVG